MLTPMCGDDAEIFGVEEGALTKFASTQSDGWRERPVPVQNIKGEASQRETRMPGFESETYRISQKHRGIPPNLQTPC